MKNRGCAPPYSCSSMESTHRHVEFGIRTQRHYAGFRLRHDHDADLAPNASIVCLAPDPPRTARKKKKMAAHQFDASNHSRDDCGENAEITTGISREHRAGVVTSTPSWRTCPRRNYALLRVRSLAERASFGVPPELCARAARCTSVRPFVVRRRVHG